MAIETSDSEWEFQYTVFTPTYDRADVLHRPYESLQRQSDVDFEWLIVDDNSTDGTAQLVERWQTEADFPIRFVQQDPERSGKHVAFNLGVELARGRFFYPLDSDDELVADALSILLKRWNEIPTRDRDSYVGVTGLCIDSSGTVVGDRFPRDPTDSNTLDKRFRLDVRGEKSGMLRTNVLREFPFPEIEGERHVPEGVVWGAIAKEYTTRYVNEPVRVYRQDDSTSRLMSDVGPARSPKGHALWHRLRLDQQLQWFRYAPLEFVRSAIHYSRFSFHSDISVVNQFRSLSWPGRLLWLAFLPLGFALYVVDRRKG